MGVVQSTRFDRLRLLLGDAGLARLQDATVVVLGLGGVGSSCAEALARGGVGTLVLLDRDVVEESNINRQALAFLSTVGQVKAGVMSRMVADINPDCAMFAERVFLTRENLAPTLARYPRPDYVLDCIDTITQKLAVAEWCAEHGVPLLSSMGAANKLDPTRLQFADLQKTRNCRMSMVLRKEARRRGLRGVEVLFSSELPVHVGTGDVRDKAHTLGSMSYLPPIMGQMLAGLTIRRLAGLKEMPPPPWVAGVEELPPRSLADQG